MKPGVTVPADLIEVGFLRGAYGLNGWVHVQAHSGDADVLRSAKRWWLRRAPSARGGEAGDEAAALEITGIRAHGSGLVAKWRGCDDPETAEALKGSGIAVSREEFPALPPGQFYWVDLVGARVVNRAGLELGVVQGLRNNGAHDVLEVQALAHGDGDGDGDGGAGSGVILIPMVPAYVDAVEAGGQCIRVDWEAGW